MIALIRRIPHIKPEKPTVFGFLPMMPLDMVFNQPPGIEKMAATRRRAEAGFPPHCDNDLGPKEGELPGEPPDCGEKIG